jgi:hypothetical protein
MGAFDDLEPGPRAARPAGKPAAPQPAGRWLRRAAVVCGVLGAAGAVYLALTMSDLLDRRRAAAELEGYGNAVVPSADGQRSGDPFGDFMRGQTARATAGAKAADRVTAKSGRLTAAAYALFGAAVLGVVGCLAAGAGRDLVAGSVFLAAYLVPLVIGRDWTLLVYPLGLADGGGLAFLARPAPPADPEDDEDEDEPARRPARRQADRPRRRPRPEPDEDE